MSITFSHFDTLFLSDSLTISLNQLSILVSDTLQLQDSVSFGYPKSKIVADTLVLTDAASVVRSGENVAEVSDSLLFSWLETVVIVKHLRLQINDTLNNWNDSLPLQASRSVVIADSMVMSDAVQVNTIIRIGILLGDLLTLADVLAVQSDSRKRVEVDPLYYRRWLND